MLLFYETFFLQKIGFIWVFLLKFCVTHHILLIDSHWRIINSFIPILRINGININFIMKLILLDLLEWIIWCKILKYMRLHFFKNSKKEDITRLSYEKLQQKYWKREKKRE